MPVRPDILRMKRITDEQRDLLLLEQAKIEESLTAGYIGYGNFEYPVSEVIASQPILLEELAWRFYQDGWYVTYVERSRLSLEVGRVILTTVLVFRSVPPSPIRLRPIC